MNEQITQTLDTEGDAPLVQVPLKDLHVSDLNGRSVIDEDGIAKLAENILQLGLIQNLAGLRQEDGRIGIVAGGRRLRALALLQDDPRFQLVPVHVTEDVTLAKEWAASENYQRERPHPADEVCEYGRMERYGIPVPSIALAFGVSEPHVPLHLFTPAGHAEEKLLRDDARVEGRGRDPGIDHLELLVTQGLRHGSLLSID